MLHLTTYFDKNYLSRGLVLYDSLKKYTSQFELYILCLDEFTVDFFESNKNKYPEVKTLQLSDIEESEPALRDAKLNRSKIEYYFTLSPCLPLYLLKKHQLPHICSLDADILFLNSPEKLFTDLDKYSIIVTPHKFSRELAFSIKYGAYNVSFQIFKNDETGLKCLELWKNQCVEWCGDEYDEVNDRFADQKYLDDWTTLYPNAVKSLDDNISGLATWNLNNYSIEKRNDDYFSNGERIVFYHFHHFKIFDKKWASNGFDEYKVKIQKGVDELYLDYWNKIEAYNMSLAIAKDNSSRYVASNNIFARLLKEKTVYRKKDEKQLENVNFAYIPKFIRKLIIKIYA